MPDRPPSATCVATSIAGVAAGGAMVFALATVAVAVHVKAMIVIAMTALVMILIQTSGFRLLYRPNAGFSFTPMRPLSIERVFRKLVGFIATLTIIGAAYWLLTEYRADMYAPYWSALGLCMPWLLAASPFYVAFMDRRQSEAEDAYAMIGAFIVEGRLPQDVRELRQHALGWMVKAFFLPLMFVYLCSSLTSFWSQISGDGPQHVMAWYRLAVNGFYLLDLIFAATGYVFTLRILDTHIRSVESSFLGWAVCLICYQPFFQATQRAYLAYDDASHWETALAAWPILQALWGTAIILCLFIFAWSTASFGLRFSNLTHRGVITTGPYRWVKHPAYLAKNISWWLISMPLLSGADSEQILRTSMLLLLVNGIYFMRALTEERHLSRDPTYLAYKEFIRHDGLWARLFRALGRRPAESHGSS